MPSIKQKVIEMIQSLPEEATVDDIMEELYFKLQVDEGLRELNGGKGISHEEVEKRMVITKNGKPVVKLIPYKSDNNLEALRGKVKYYGDIISPIDEDWNAGK